jgi:hypothetical protein
VDYLWAWAVQPLKQPGHRAAFDEDLPSLVTHSESLDRFQFVRDPIKEILGQIFHGQRVRLGLRIQPERGVQPVGHEGLEMMRVRHDAQEPLLVRRRRYNSVFGESRALAHVVEHGIVAATLENVHDSLADRDLRGSYI